MVPDRSELFWTLSGNLVVGLGAGTATNAAFAPTLPLVDDPHFLVRVSIVSLGFALFFAGYHITQAGMYRSPGESLGETLVPGTGDGTATAGRFDPVLAIRATAILAGVFLLGAGMRLFAMTIDTWSATFGLMSGVVCIGGYICGHIGINWRMI